MNIRVVRAYENSVRRRIAEMLGDAVAMTSGRRARQRKAFDGIITFAKRLAAQDREALHGLITIMARPVQAWALGALLYRDPSAGPIGCDPADLLFDPRIPLSPDGRGLYEIAKELDTSRITIDLSKDVVLPWPWNQDRLADALSGLRPGGAWGPWAYGDGNHVIEWWTPLRIGWVANGTHSLAAGVVYGTGRLKAQAGFDVSDVYDHVRCDGAVYRRTWDGKVVARVVRFEVGVIFEIGRLLIERAQG